MRSIVSYEERGNGGNNKYRGNCSPRLITDLVNQFKIQQLSDYMCGSNSTKAGCENSLFNVEYHGYDLHSGFDLLNMDIKERNESIFWHPPYHDIIKYSGNMYSEQKVLQQYGYNPAESDLSRCKDWNDFVQKMNYCMMKQFTSLEKGGYMFVLMGDIKKRGRLYSMLTDIVKPGKMVNIVIKQQHNCFSNKTIYSNNNFIPIEHEYILIVQKDKCLTYPIKYTNTFENDIRDMESATWKDILADILSDGKKDLQEIYSLLDGRKKARNNSHWKEKIRQTLNINDIFKRESRGVYSLA